VVDNPIMQKTTVQKTPTKVPQKATLTFANRPATRAKEAEEKKREQEELDNRLVTLENQLELSNKEYQQLMLDGPQPPEPPKDTSNETLLRVYDMEVRVFEQRMRVWDVQERNKKEAISELKAERRRLEEKRERTAERDEQRAYEETKREHREAKVYTKISSISTFTPAGAADMPYDYWYNLIFWPEMSIRCHDSDEVLANLKHWVHPKCWSEFSAVSTPEQIADLDYCNAQLERIFGEKKTYEELVALFTGYAQRTDDVEHYARQKERLYKRAHSTMTIDEIRRSHDFRQGFLKGIYKPFAIKIAKRDDYMACEFQVWLDVVLKEEAALKRINGTYGKEEGITRRNGGGEQREEQKRERQDARRNNTNNDNSNTPTGGQSKGLCRYGKDCFRRNCRFVHEEAETPEKPNAGQTEKDREKEKEKEKEKSEQHGAQQKVGKQSTIGGAKTFVIRAEERVSEKEVFATFSPVKNERMIAEGSIEFNKTTTAMKADKLVRYEFGFDSHSDVSVLPARLLPAEFDRGCLWKYNGTVHGASAELRIEGSVRLPVILRNVRFEVDFLVSADDSIPYPLLGNDFWNLAKCKPDYNGGMQITTSDNTTITVPFTTDDYPVRLQESVTAPPGMARDVEVLLPRNFDNCLWMIERNDLTKGALTIPSTLCEQKEGKVVLTITNWGSEAVHLAKGALIANASPVKIIKLDEKEAKRARDGGERQKEDEEGDRMKVEEARLKEAGDRMKGEAVRLKDEADRRGEGKKKEESREIKLEAKIGEGWTKKQDESIRQFLNEQLSTFAKNPSAPRPYKGPAARIDTGNAIPFKDNPRRTSPAKELEIKKHVEEMKRNGIIEEACSPWSSPVVLVRKRDGATRFCVDYRRLNSITRKDAYPLPRIDAILDALGASEARVFSTMDVSSGYWHIPIEETDREKTAFTTNSGTYQFRVLPFGLTAAPAIFCRAMNACLSDLLWRCVLVYVDDIVVWSESFESHLNDLAEVFSRLRAQGFQLKLSKCTFFAQQVDYLGYTIRAGCIAMSTAKVEAIAKFAPPTTKKDLQSFLGMTNWYRRFIRNYSKIARPLHELLGKNEQQKWHFDADEASETRQAFEALKRALCEYPILRLPDFTKEFLVICDASKEATGAALAQEHDGFEHPVHYISKAIKQERAVEHSYFRETLALVRALKAFRHYVAYTPFVVVTDCRALSFWNVTKEIPAQVESYLSYISQYQIAFVHRPGTQIPTSDALSRDPRYRAMNEHAQQPFDAQSMRGGKYSWAMLQQQQSTEKQQQSTEKQQQHWAPRSFVILQREAVENNLGLRVCGLWEDQEAQRTTNAILRSLRNGDEMPADVKSIANKLELVEDHLFRKATAQHKRRPYVPIPARRRILEALHVDVLAGHGGVDKTTQRVAARFWWEDMKKDILEFVRKCPCHLNKHAGLIRKAPLQPINIGEPFEEWVIDHLELPKTEAGHAYVLTCEDRFTKLVELIATTTKGMEEAAESFRERVLLRWGTPRRVLADNAFEGKFAELCKENGIDLQHSLPHQHDTVGLAERMNRTVQEILRAYTNAEGTDWDRFLPAVQFAVNTGRAAAHGFTPFRVVTGREAVLPIELTIYQSNNDVTNEAKRVENAAREKLEESQRKMVEQHEKKNATGSYAIGEWVSIKKHVRESALDSTRIGPFKIAAKDERPNNFVLLFCNLPGTELRAHQNDLLPWPGITDVDVVNVSLPMVEYRQPERPSVTLTRQLDVVRARYALPKSQPVQLRHLIGKRIQTKWAKWKSPEPGTVVAHEGNGRFWVRYDDVEDDDGSHYFRENLLAARPPQWVFVDLEDKLRSEEVAL
jgi:hypothetical protein